MEPNGITRVRCNLYRFNEETLGEPVTVRVFENFPHEWPRRAGISSSSSFEIQDTRPSPFTRGFLSFRANLFSFSQVFPFPCKWKSIPPRILLFFSFKKKIQSQLENWRRRFFRSNGIIFLQTRKHNPVNHRNRKRVMHSERTKEAKVSSNILPEWINSPPPYLSILSKNNRGWKSRRWSTIPPTEMSQSH